MRFTNDNPWVLGYLLQNAVGFDAREVLSGSSSLEERSAVFFDRLAHDQRFSRALLPIVGRYLEHQGISTLGFPVRTRVPLAFDQVVALATRFYLPDYDRTTGQLFGRLCAHAQDLREMPIPPDDAIEAWVYGAIRGALESQTDHGVADKARAIIHRHGSAPGPLSPEERVRQAQEEIWLVLQSDPGLRRLIREAYDSRGAYGPFVVK